MALWSISWPSDLQVSFGLAMALWPKSWASDLQVSFGLTVEFVVENLGFRFTIVVGVCGGG